MKAINLLETKSFTLSYRQAFGIFALVLGLAIFGGGALSYYPRYLAQRAAGIQQNLDKLRQKKARLEADTKQAQVKAQLATLAVIFQQESSWAPLLRELTNQIPPNIWLTSIQTQNDPKQAQEVLIRGVSHESQALTTFLQSLNQNTYIRQALLSDTQIQMEGQRLAYQFTIKCETRP